MPIKPGSPYFLQNTGMGPTFPEYWVTLGIIPPIHPPPPVPVRGGTQGMRLPVIFKPAISAPPMPNLYEIEILSASVGRDEATPKEPVRLQPHGAMPQVWELRNVSEEEGVEVYEIYFPESIDSWALSPYGNPEDLPPVELLPPPQPIGGGGHRWKLIPAN
ncbi:hypothetical protein CTheo_6063 [Ceratobasidium theobromae]|uniref:Uncharacterized protein n=1 Tax=Ceratobasidium theobromae TaxID=1582974 RepID=A0A5N5QG95_9AGAM|nr:hypothetical protein CTheo_6063 [Ceratobasidium theobromae]